MTQVGPKSVSVSYTDDSISSAMLKPALSSPRQPAWCWYAMVLIIAVGIGFRFWNLGLKFYWHDEALTSLSLSGYTLGQFRKQTFTGAVLAVDDLRKFQTVNHDHGIVDTVHWLIAEHTHHPPGYYVLARQWAEWFGSQPTAMRSLPALISLFVIPAMYWLGLELFGSRLVAGFSVALVSVSPLHVLFAQECREYSLWTVAVLVSGAALLRAIRLGGFPAWALYAATVGLALYSHLLSLAVAYGQMLYTLMEERFRWSRRTAGCACALLTAGTAFLPWALALVANARMVSGSLNWTEMDVGVLELLGRWAMQLTLVFLDLGPPTSAQFQLAVPAVLVLEAYALYLLCRHSPRRVWLFVLTLIGFSTLALLVPDLLLGGIRSATPRYAIPGFLGIQLAVAYLLSRQVSAGKVSTRRCWSIIAALLVGGEVISCGVSAQAATWWNKQDCGRDLQSVSQIVNRCPGALLVTTDYYESAVGETLALSDLLNGRVRLILASDSSQPVIPAGFKRVFVFNTSPEFLHYLAQSGQFLFRKVGDHLWIGERYGRAARVYDRQE